MSILKRIGQRRNGKLWKLRELPKRTGGKHSHRRVGVRQGAHEERNNEVWRRAKIFHAVAQCLTPIRTCPLVKLEDCWNRFHSLVAKTAEGLAAAELHFRVGIAQALD